MTVFHHRPPKFALRFFRWYCRRNRLEELEGDLLETFNKDTISSGATKAKFRYCLNIIRCMRSYALKPLLNTENPLSNVSTMILAHFKTTYRNFLKNKSFGAINLLGLIMSFSACILISIYIKYETSFENFHSKADQVYRVSYKVGVNNGFQTHWAKTDVDFVNLLPDEIPGIKELIRFQNQEQKYIKIEDLKFKEKHVYVTDNEVFSVFDFNMAEGSSKTALSDPYSIVITEALAKKYFKDQPALGKEIQILGDWSAEPVTHKVTGVIQDVPSNTHLPVDMFLSFKNEEERTWWAYVYILVEEGATIAELDQKISDFVETQVNDQRNIDLVLQPIKDIHLHSNLAREIVPNGNFQNIKILAIIGLFILLVGVVNFINLFSAMSMSRVKQVGVKKVLGASKDQIMLASIIESVIYSLLSMSLASIIVYIIYPYFETITEISFLYSPLVFVGALIVVSTLVGIVAGIYPSLIALQFQPIQLMQKQGFFQGLSKDGFSFKKIMLVFQFCISIFLLACALIARDQFQYLYTQNLELKPEEIVAIPRPRGDTDNFGVFKEQLQAVQGVKSVSSCMQVPSSEIRDVGPFQVGGLHANREEAPIFDIQVIDHDFFELMNIKILAGENIPEHLRSKTVPIFTEEYDQRTYLMEQKRWYLINESAMRELGFTTPSEVIGKQASWAISNIELAKGSIIGVVEDYHQETMKNKVDPTLYTFEPVWLGTFLVRIDTKNIGSTLENIEEKWDQFFPNYPIEYSFLDDLYDQLYKTEQSEMELLYGFSSLSLVIVFMGILGLVAYSLKLRMKEMAVRKVLGATQIMLTRLIANQYVILLLIGSFIAIPASYYAATVWLDRFAYRVGISPLNYLWTFFAVVIILLITISFQVLRTTDANPSKFLRDE